MDSLLANSNAPLSEIRPEGGLSALEVGIIDLFVGAVRMIGIPKSVGEIYGLLYATATPVTLDTIVRRLSMSKGSASQGLKVLKAIGAVTSVYVSGDRRDHFVAEIELKRLVAGFMREEIKPRLESGEQKLSRLSDLAAQAPEGPEGELLRYRVSKLGQWSTRGREMIPLMGGLLE